LNPIWEASFGGLLFLDKIFYPHAKRQALRGGRVILGAERYEGASAPFCFAVGLLTFSERCAIIEKSIAVVSI
jgi:hypothetical protein